MVENLQIESSLLKLGRSELIATIIIFAIRIKYPDIFSNLLQDVYPYMTSFELQIPIMIILGLIIGLFINLGTESAEVFILLNFFWKRYKLEDEYQMIKEKIGDIPTYSPYFDFKEKHLVYYNIIRTIGNRYSKNCDTILAENRYRHSAYFMVYGFIFLISLFILLIPPDYNPIIILIIIGFIVAIIMLFYSAHQSFKRLKELIHLAVVEQKYTEIKNIT